MDKEFLTDEEMASLGDKDFLTDNELVQLENPSLTQPKSPQEINALSNILGGVYEGAKGLVTFPYDAFNGIYNASDRVAKSNDKFGQVLDETGKAGNLMVETAGQGLGAIAGSVFGGSGAMTGGGVGQTIAREGLTGLKGLSDLLMGTNTFKAETDAQANKTFPEIANEMYRNMGQTGGGLGVSKVASKIMKPVSTQTANNLKESAVNSRLDAMDATNTQMAGSALETANLGDDFLKSKAQIATRVLADEGVFNSSNPKVLNQNLVNKQNQTSTNISNIVDQTDSALPNGITLDRATLESQLKSKFAQQNRNNPKKRAIYNSNIDNFLDGMFDGNTANQKTFKLKELDARRQEFGKYFDEADAIGTEVAKSFYEPLRDIIDNEVSNVSPQLLSELQKNNKVFESLVEIDPIVRKYTAKSNQGSFGEFLKKSFSQFGGGATGISVGFATNNPLLGVATGVGTNLALQGVTSPKMRFAGANLKEAIANRSGMPKVANAIDSNMIPVTALVNEQDSDVVPYVNNALDETLGIPKAQGEEIPQEEPIDFNSPDLQNVGQALGVNQPQQDFSQGIPRNSAEFTPEAMNYIIQSSAGSPKALVISELARNYGLAEKAGETGKKRKLLEDLSRVAPEYFEQGSGIDNRLSDPTSQADYMKMMYNKLLRGKLDPQIFAKQHQSFADNGDGTIIPLEKDNQSRIQIQSPNGTIDRLKNPLY